MHVLHLDSSILGENSASRALSAAVAERIKALHSGADFTYVDLAERSLGHLTGSHLAVWQGVPIEQMPHVEGDIVLGGAAMEQLLSADVVVIGVAMYNFTVSTQLKAWIDRVAVAGKTFRYTESGAQGLLGGKRVILCVARGSIYSGDAPSAPMEFAERYVKGVMSFFGITDVQSVVAEGLAISPEMREAAMAQALAQVAALNL